MPSLLSPLSRFPNPHRTLACLVALGSFTGCASSPAQAALPLGTGGAVSTVSRHIAGVAVRLVTIDLKDPHTVLDIGLANRAKAPNTAQHTAGDEPFRAMSARSQAAAVINGTYFSMDKQKRVMGNMVRQGKLVKYSKWEDEGTTFSLHAGNVPELVTARAQGEPDTASHWLSITAGPRLLRDGRVWLHPHDEGFHDPDITGRAGRTALGFTRSGDRLILASFPTPVTLKQEAAVMQELGLYQAMNMDGGSSQALSVHGKSYIVPSRRLTNVLAVYDREAPAPADLANAFARFGRTHASAAATEGPAARHDERMFAKLRPGMGLAYAGLKFCRLSHAPIVGVVDGALTLSAASFGQIYAPWNYERKHYALEFDARVLDEHLSLFVDNAKGNRGASLDLHPKSGMYLRQAGKVIGTPHLTGTGWHHYRLEVKQGKTSLYVDRAHTPVLVAAGEASAHGIGLAGKGQVRKIGWNALR